MCIFAILILIALIIWTIWGNTALMINSYILTSNRLPKAFSGLRIAQISDLHNTEFGHNNEALLSLLKSTQPDIILITGDLIDSRRTDIPLALAFAKEAAKIAPTYLSTGNHESRVYHAQPDAYQQFETDLRANGLHSLRGETAIFEKEDEIIQIIGLDDPNFYDLLYPGKKSEALMIHDLNELKKNDTYTILLSHRPERFSLYADSGIDLIFSGHTHGGQFRLPILGGILAPHQGIFPKYDGGFYIEETDEITSQMIVSRGIGNSLFPFRFNNRPEIVLVELMTDSSSPTARAFPGYH